MIVNGLKGDLTESERDSWDAANPDVENFFERMYWSQEESGGASADVSVLLSSSSDLGIDYGSMQVKLLLLLHGENDTMVPIAGAEWLSEQIPSSVLKRVDDCSHNGVMFHESVMESLGSLAVP